MTSSSAAGVFIDDIVVSTGAGLDLLRGRRRHDGRLDRSRSARRAAPATTTTGSSAPPRTSRTRRARSRPVRSPASRRSSASSGSNFGPYPFSTGGGIVDDVEGLGFALETQTRPVYARDFFTDSFSGDTVVVHEIAHQWYGDSLAVAALAAHLAQRGVRHIRRMAVERGPGSWAPPRRSSTSGTRCSRPTTRSGASSSAIRGRTRCSNSPSTSAGR